ncbi:MAG: radical SAM protein, partial [Chloroflexi bacterium]|nr:radical SAM protein [Chloroflexota bacterium]
MSTAANEFQVFVKPNGAICNLECRYCYYLPKRELYPDDEAFRMPDELLERYIVQHIEASPSERIQFSWHGGESTALGIDFFRRVVAVQRKHLPAGRQVLNSLQTNGTLLDDDWCQFFRAEKFSVGLSLDGPQELHDRYRVTRGRKPTHKRVLESWRLLRRYRVPCDLLCVVHNQNAEHPRAVYRFFKDIGAEYLQFIPLVARRANGEVTSETVSPEAYGKFLCTIFHEWVRNDVGRIGIQIF